VGGLNVQVFADADYAGMAADSRSETRELVMCVSRTQKCADTWPSQT